MCSNCHISCHQAGGRSLNTRNTPARRVPGAGPHELQAGSRPLQCTGAAWGLVFKAPGKARPISPGHKSPGREPEQAETLWGGLARPKSLEGREGEQDSGSVPRVLAATLGHTSFSEARLDSALPPPRPGKGRQGQGGLLRTLEACLEPVKQSIHLGTGPTEQYVFKRFLPK